MSTRPSASTFNDSAIELIKCRNSNEFYVLCGKIAGKSVTAISTISATTYYSGDKANFEVSMFLDKIIIGVESFDDILITALSAEIPALDWFYMDSPVKMNFKSNPISFYLELDKPLSTKWYNGRINLFRTCKINDSFSSSSYTNENILEFTSTKGVDIHYACQKLFEFRSLIIFLADFGINILPEIKISLKDDENIYTIYFNDMEYFNREISTPFRIRYNTTKNNYNRIYKNWKSFYSKNKTVVELYIEIVAKHSKKINCFLDLARIIETYSKRNRDNEAKNICRKDKVNCKSSCTNCEICGQYYRYLEMFIAYGKLLPSVVYSSNIFNKNISLNINKIEILCNDITLLRNHYTHYGEPRGKNINKDKRRLNKLLKSPLVYGDYSRLLHLLMLAVIYSQLGFSENEIKNALIGGESGRFGDSLEIKYGKIDSYL